MSFGSSLFKPAPGKPDSQPGEAKVVYPYVLTQIEKLSFQLRSERLEPELKAALARQLHALVVEFFKQAPSKEQVIKLFDCPLNGILIAAVLVNDLELLKLCLEKMEGYIEESGRKLEFVRWGFKTLLEAQYCPSRQNYVYFWDGTLALEFIRVFFKLRQKNKSDKPHYLADCEWSFCGVEYAELIWKLVSHFKAQATQEAVALICDQFQEMLPAVQQEYLIQAFIALLIMRNGPKDQALRLVCYGRLFQVDMSAYKSLDEFFAANYQKGIFPKHALWPKSLAAQLLSTTFLYDSDESRRLGRQELFSFSYWTWKNAVATNAYSHSRKEWFLQALKNASMLVYDETTLARVRELVETARLVPAPREYSSFEERSEYSQLSQSVKLLQYTLDRFYPSAAAETAEKTTAPEHKA